MELDSHADTCVLGTNFTVLEYSGRVCDVYPYSSEYEAVKDIPIVQGATAVQDQQTGELIIMIINEGLWYGNKMDHSLINPNQLRYFGVKVNDNPFSPDNMYIHHIESDIMIPLQAQGTTIYVNSRAPTDHELQTCQHIECTSPSQWNPHTVKLASISSDIEHPVNFDGSLDQAYELANNLNIINSDALYLSYIS
jgi:hypothetical protein